jgi:hypothetical protein
MGTVRVQQSLFVCLYVWGGYGCVAAYVQTPLYACEMETDAFLGWVSG